MLTPLLLLWPVSLALTWLVAQSIAGKPFDRALEYNVRALAQLVTVSGQQGAVQPAPARREILRADDSDSSTTRCWARAANTSAATRPAPAAGEDRPLPATPLLRDVHLRDDELRGLDVRVAYLWVRLACRATRRPWCRWPKRAKSARCWPPKSSRA
jgi:two-component system sensor histidine kinase TctE